MKVNFLISQRSMIPHCLNPESRRTYAASVTFVIESVRQLGVEPHPESRLMKMLRVLHESHNIIAPDNHNFEVAAEALRDVQLLSYIFDHLGRKYDALTFHRLIKLALKDSVLPQDDCSQSKGRDAQFELYLAAICQGGGLTPVEFEEPDVTCFVNGTKFGIAAKRVKSVSNLRKLLKSASLQIGASNLPGIVAIDTCLALNPNNERICTPIREAEFSRLYSAAIKQFIDQHLLRIRQWVAGAGVIGVIIHDHQVRVEEDGEWGLVSMTYGIPFRDKDATSLEFSSFMNHYVKGLPNLEHL